MQRGVAAVTEEKGRVNIKVTYRSVSSCLMPLLQMSAQGTTKQIAQDVMETVAIYYNFCSTYLERDQKKEKNVDQYP